jgi:DNA polymerase
MQQELAALQWYIDAGADEAYDDTPRNYFKEDRAAPAPVKPVASPPPPKQTTLSASTQSVYSSLASVVAEARRLADACESLSDLKSAISSFDGCAIKKTATNTVFADGNSEAKMMLIGEAPGVDEDIRGIPFCGVSGKLLDRMLAAIEYDRTKFYITNTTFWRPPGNRQPNSDELAICKPFVERHIALVDPELLVFVGGVAAKALLGTEQGITRLRGKTYTYRTPYSDKDYKVAVIYHPSYLLRQPINKRITWQDLLSIKKMLH